MSDTVLKGGVSYNRYVWCTSGDTCEACQDLDGTEYEYEGDIPDQPHPHCQCYIEIIGGGDDGDDDEPCDCVEQVHAWMDECEEACGDAESLIDESNFAQNSLEEIADYIANYTVEIIDEFLDELTSIIENALTEIYEAIEETIATIGIFYENWHQLTTLTHTLGEYLDGSAEYYHTKANCEAAQLGDVGAEVATILGYLRELGDFPKEILVKGQSIKDAFEHSVYDLKINEAGRELGKEHPDEKPEDIIVKPEGLPERFW